VFLALSKWLDVLVEPLAWALLLGLAALALCRRRPAAALASAAAAIAVLWGFSTPWVAGALARAAEEPARDTSRADVTYDAVIVLGGGMSFPGSIAAGRFEVSEAGDRVLRGYELLRAGRARFGVVSGGALDELPGSPREAEVAVRMLAAWGVDPSRLVAEANSRNTRENALECARIVRERGWSRLLLVTSAAHVPRAMGCFRAVGLAPDALPVDRRAGTAPLSLRSILPRASALDRSADVIRELAGRLVYRVAGYAR
jgi:uncharacterized SAM-binding protein YcdF (DUF218 family)